MEINADVLYEGALAQYEVELDQEGQCTAHLIAYKGKSGQRPPEQINLRKEGRGWTSNITEDQLLNDLGYAIELKAKPLLERKRDQGHPAA